MLFRSVEVGEPVVRSGAESVEVASGDVVHLGSGTNHRFTDFDDEFVVAVMYAPAEGSQAV